MFVATLREHGRRLGQLPAWGRLVKNDVGRRWQSDGRQVEKAQAANAGAERRANISDDTKKTKGAASASKARILKIPRQVLSDWFYQHQVSRENVVHTRLFSLMLRKLDRRTCSDINVGPSWLRGDYPAGLLEGRHERRRPINHLKKQVSRGWRDVNEEGPVAERADKYDPPVEPLTRKSPLLIPGAGLQGTPAFREQAERWIPVLGITSIKKVDKRAVYRNRAKTRVLTAFENVLSSHIDSMPTHDQAGNVLAYVFYPRPEVIPLPIAEIEKVVEKALINLTRSHSQSASHKMPRQHDRFKKGSAQKEK